MTYAEEALQLGGSAEQMAEAGARWFRGERTDCLVSGLILLSWSKRRKTKRDGTEGLDRFYHEIAYALTKNGEQGCYTKLLRVRSRFSRGHLVGGVY